MEHQALINGMETFTTANGEIFKRPVNEGRRIGDRVGIIRDKSVELTGYVKEIKEIGGEFMLMINVGGRHPIPRRLDEIAIPLT